MKRSFRYPEVKLILLFDYGNLSAPSEYGLLSIAQINIEAKAGDDGEDESVYG